MTKNDYENHKKEASNRSHEYYLKHRSEAIARSRQYYRTHRDEVSASRKQYRLKNKPHIRFVKRKRQLKVKYGLTHEKVNDFVMSQKGCCAICKTPFEKTPVVDHDHEKHIVRGLLCSDCNLGLGLFNDDAHLLEKAAQYLERHAIRQELASK